MLKATDVIKFLKRKQNELGDISLKEVHISDFHDYMFFEENGVLVGREGVNHESCTHPKIVELVVGEYGFHEAYACDVCHCVVEDGIVDLEKKYKQVPVYPESDYD